MAHSPPDQPLGLSYRARLLETFTLKLTAKHFPFPCSLRELVVQRYATQNTNTSSMLTMEMDELIEYLRGTSDLSLTPMQSILAQTEAIGDPSLPSQEQTAILLWVGAAFEDWEHSFPLEQPLRNLLRKLKPLIAERAITDPSFLSPGAHPLHQMLDALQLAAVGWQTKLGRAGENLPKQIAKSIEDALSCRGNSQSELAPVCMQVVTTVERDQARANRMAQRTIEAEAGKSKTAHAKRIAAGLINTGLRQFPIPSTIEKFLKGPWYESAQLVLLKHGEESSQWEQMSATTATILASVRYTETEENSSQRQQLFELVTQLPRELKRWLISIEHDREAIESAMGMVEYTHMQILRRRPLELEHAKPIPVIEPAARADAAKDALAAFSVGQWLSVDLTGEHMSTRMQLALRMEDEGELIFTNMVGLRVLQQRFDEFVALLDGGRVNLLDSGASFSRSLARAVDITTSEELGDLLSPEELQLRLKQEKVLAQTGGLGTGRTPRKSRPAFEGLDISKSLKAEQKTTNEPAPVALNVGAWLGFHDGETPLLARFAIYDQETKTHIFVNRNGIKLRQLSNNELLDLIAQGQVEVLETSSNFRNEIDKAKQRSEG